ncbi:MAG TPA: hypothetical protein VF145_02345, partial [Chitinophagaceae bacterium]
MLPVAIGAGGLVLFNADRSRIDQTGQTAESSVSWNDVSPETEEKTAISENVGQNDAKGSSVQIDISDHQFSLQGKTVSQVAQFIRKDGYAAETSRSATGTVEGSRNSHSTESDVNLTNVPAAPDASPKIIDTVMQPLQLITPATTDTTFASSENREPASTIPVHKRRSW